jgi:hypothetical protein
LWAHNVLIDPLTPEHRRIAMKKRPLGIILRNSAQSWTAYHFSRTGDSFKTRQSLVDPAPIRADVSLFNPVITGKGPQRR